MVSALRPSIGASFVDETEAAAIRRHLNPQKRIQEAEFRYLAALFYSQGRSHDAPINMLKEGHIIHRVQGQIWSFFSYSLAT
jgi:hypothetical protein